jgi:hypothetical protein
MEEAAILNKKIYILFAFTLPFAVRDYHSTVIWSTHLRMRFKLDWPLIRLLSVLHYFKRKIPARKKDDILS